MPLRPRPGTAPVPAAGSPAVPAPAPTASSESEMLLPALLGGGLVAGAYVLTKNPKIASTVGRGVLDLRRMSMLSGLAPLKSFLGNVGGTAIASVERGSMAPLKELLSMQTVRDAGRAFKAGAVYEGTPATALSKLNVPGRFMGALDEAAQNALVRSGVMHDPEAVAKMVEGGMSLAEATEKSARAAAAREMLQSPLPREIAAGLENPYMEYAVPFRRTTHNQLYKGGEAFNANTRGKKIALATALGFGAVTGAMAEDPKTVGLGTASMGRYGLPFATGAAIGRTLSTGKPSKGAEVLTGMSPVSDYSLAQAANNIARLPQLATDPGSNLDVVVPKPAAISALKYLRSLVGW